MDIDDLVRRTAWRAGASEELADRLIETFLLELGESIGRGELVDLGPFGAFIGAAYRPGAAAAPAGADRRGRRA
ncbi:HU family DNA-binding protein [Miltoncostaea marina]|uniref:HU family DNA-binding protein n=1 Tax=Miltoncostaea marina TaxID=2843215 RepID=UPI001C3D530D|nr:HU family DNA-binding protein [Miltoncostaea marina]